MPYLIGKHPFLKLKVRPPKRNRWIYIECLIDTGFSGGLVLPLSYKKDFPNNEFIEARYLLADNSEITVDATYTVVDYESFKREVAVVFMGDSQGLVGVEFLDQLKFCLDLKDKTVELG